MTAERYRVVGGFRLWFDNRQCPHYNDNACSTCDFDGYYESKYGALCPWGACTSCEGRGVTEEVWPLGCDDPDRVPPVMCADCGGSGLRSSQISVEEPDQ